MMGPFVVVVVHMFSILQYAGENLNNSDDDSMDIPGGKCRGVNDPLERALLVFPATFDHHIFYCFVMQSCWMH